MINININELRRLTQAATPGPWHFWRGWVAADIDSDGGIIITERPKLSGGKYQARVDGNFRFIAATNPAVISELLDRLEAAEKGHDELHTAVCREGDRADAYQVGVFVLRGRLEAAEKERDELRTELKEVRREVAMAHYTINTLQAKRK